MASVIKIKRSTTPGAAPGALAAGEIAVNIPDRQLFVGDGSTIYRIGAQYLSVANAAATYQTIATERAALANTNAYIATKVSTTTFNSALANTNSYIGTKLNSNNPVITGTLTANGSVGSSGYFLRSTGSGIYWDALPSQTQYLQVANAVATYQTIATERAALANTNARISLVNTNLTNTNTALRTLISDRLQVANAASIYATKSNPTTSGVLAHTGRATISTNLAVSGNTSISGNLTVDGNLTVEGAVTYISSSTLNVDDSMIKLAANNAADTVDVGLYGKYVSSGTKYSGLFRDASDGVWKFYTGSQDEPGTTVDIGATGYTVGTIEAVIDGGTY